MSLDQKARVFRAIVMDGANNSVKRCEPSPLRTPSTTSPPWMTINGTIVVSRSRSYPMRYRYGKATLRDLEIELEDSQEKGYLIATRAIIIEWDHGRKTVLLTSFLRPPWMRARSSFPIFVDGPLRS